MSIKVELCVASHLAIMLSMQNLQLSFVFLHFLDPYVKNLHPDYGTYLIA